MITSKKDYKEYIKQEKKNYQITFTKIVASFFGASEVGIIWRYQKRLRRFEYHLNRKHKIRKLFWKIRTNKFGRKYGFSIGPNWFEIGLKIMHLGSILVNNNVRVGKNCSMHINTALVASGGIEKAPQCGDDVVIGVGATLVGDIKLGNNIAIGAGAVVTKSFLEDGVVLAGVPAKIISHKGKDAF